MHFRSMRIGFRTSLLLIATYLALVRGSVAQQHASPTVSASGQRACEKAQSQMELNQCSGEQYRLADDRLVAVYRKALDLLQKDLSDGSGARTPTTRSTIRLRSTS